MIQTMLTIGFLVLLVVGLCGVNWFFLVRGRHTHAEASTPFLDFLVQSGGCRKG